jgi:hypothetical protein
MTLRALRAESAEEPMAEEDEEEGEEEEDDDEPVPLGTVKVEPEPGAT